MRSGSRIYLAPLLFLILLFLPLCSSAQETVATPVISPNGGSFITSVDVNITCATTLVEIHYTTDGDDPTQSDPLYMQGYPLTVAKSMTLKARAFKAGMNQSAVVSADFTITVATPTFIHDGGLYAEPQNVRIQCGTPGATCYYTLDESEPSDASTPYTGPVVIPWNRTLRARAYKPDCEPSEIKTAVYTFRSPRTIYVSTTGDNTDGRSWATARRTVQDGVNTCIPGDEVWVKAGTYRERVTMAHGVKLYGGFAGWEGTRDGRDPSANETILDCGGIGGVYFPQECGTTTVLDGFTIKNSRYSAVYADQATGTIRGNRIVDVIAVNQGVICIKSPCEPYAIVNNVIIGAPGQVINIYESTPGHRGLIANNTIVNSSNIAMTLFNTNVDVINNLIAFNYCGINCTWPAGLYIANNCVYGNQRYDYWNYDLQGEFPHPTDINVDPLLVDETFGDYHLLPRSPCIDAGLSLPAVGRDVECIPRPVDGHHDGVAAWDIGAYEYPASLGRAKRLTGDCLPIAFGPVPVTASFPTKGIFYVETWDRSAGICIEPVSEPVPNEGSQIVVLGTFRTNTTGERFLVALPGYPQVVGTCDLPDPVSMSVRSLGGGSLGLQPGVGAELNNIGLLVTTWGRVVEFDDPESPTSWFKVNDGSASPVKVAVPDGVTINKDWGFVVCTGISSCERTDPMDPTSAIVKVLKVRRQSDIVPIQ